MRPHRLYVGTIGEGLFRSTDAGRTFVRAADGMFVECHVRALVIHPQQPRTLYLGSEQGLFRSTDGAVNWNRVDSPLDGRQIWSITFFSQTGLAVGTCPSKFFVTHDDGKTWMEPDVRLRQECPRIMHTRVTTLLADQAEPEAIWAGVEIDGLYRSRDAGRSWQQVGKGLSSLDIHSLAIVKESGGSKRMIATTNNDVNVSTDNGETWLPLGLGRSMPSPYFRALIVLPSRPGWLLLGNGDAPPGSVGAIGRSEDGGRTWTLARLPGKANSTIWNFAVHPADPDLVYASSVSGELYRSLDAGISWERLDREFGEIRALAWEPE